MKKIISTVIILTLIPLVGLLSYHIVYNLCIDKSKIDIKIEDTEHITRIDENILYNDESFYNFIKPEVIKKLELYNINCDNLDNCERNYVEVADAIGLSIFYEDYEIDVEYNKTTGYINITLITQRSDFYKW